jgi:hypothetical protein
MNGLELYFNPCSKLYKDFAILALNIVRKPFPYIHKTKFVDFSKKTKDHHLA